MAEETQSELLWTPEQKEELTKLEFEYQRFSLAAAILEQKLRIRQISELLKEKPTGSIEGELKTKRKVEDY